MKDFISLTLRFLTRNVSYIKKLFVLTGLFFRSADFFQNQTLIIFKELDVSENAVGVSGSSALFAMLAENTTVEKLGNKASLKINAK